MIMEWADLHSDAGPRLFPADPEARIEALTDEALGNGMLDTAMALLIERHLRAPEARDERVGPVCLHKLRAALDWLEAEAARLAARPFDAGHISVGVALSYLDFRFADLGWRTGRPALAAWHDGFRARPSVAATDFRDDPRPEG